MFGTVRKHSQPLWIVIIIMVVISFVVYFTPGYDPFENRGGTATEADVELSFARGQVLLERPQHVSAIRRISSPHAQCPSYSRAVRIRI